jgi:hypothetical protein
MPFSFVYDGQPSDKLLLDWPKKAETRRFDANRTQHAFTWTDPKTGMEVRCFAVEYSDYPAVEWRAYFRNNGKQDTPALKDIRGIDTSFQRTADGEFVLHGTKGDWRAADSFQPFQEALAARASKRFVSSGGRPTNHAFPYYNLQMPVRGGDPARPLTCYAVRLNGTSPNHRAPAPVQGLFLLPPTRGATGTLSHEAVSRLTGTISDSRQAAHAHRHSRNVNRIPNEVNPSCFVPAVQCPVTPGVAGLASSVFKMNSCSAA